MAAYPSYPTDQYAQQYAQPAADPYHAAAAYGAQAYAPAPAAYGYNPDELRTVFLTGFPDDVKEREGENGKKDLLGKMYDPFRLCTSILFLHELTADD